MATEITFTIDEDSASIYIMKIYRRQVSPIWKHFSEKELLDKWWAPKPWKCETQKINFAESGVWFYAMKSPDGEKVYAKAIYDEIMFHRSISWSDYFTNENEKINTDFPSVNWLIGFTGIEQGTKLTVNLYFNSKEDLHKILEMGFREGFEMGLNQLEEVTT